MAMATVGLKDVLNKITEIKRLKCRTTITNYYNNCKDGEDIWGIFGDKSVVFWNDDNGTYRAYFYSCDEEELVPMLKKIPSGVCLEYLTKNENEFVESCLSSGFEQIFTMMRYVESNDEELIRQAKEYWENVREAVYVPGMVVKAEVKDADAILKKLYEVFNPLESHLCTKEELIDYINKGWVCCSYDDNCELTGLQIFLVEAGYCKYGYQIWSDGNPEVLCNLQIVSRDLYDVYIAKIEQEKGKKITPRPGYAWVNMGNRKAVKNVKLSGSIFDGLYDYGFRKI